MIECGEEPLSVEVMIKFSKSLMQVQFNNNPRLKSTMHANFRESNYSQELICAALSQRAA